MTRPKNNGLAYLRRSTDKQEISLPRQISWSIDAALAEGVRLDAGASDLDHMQSLRLHSYKGIRLDDGITGSDLTRPGFLAFNRDALKDPAISHLYFYKRDRFARPTDAMQAVAFEKELLWAGITVVHSDGVSTPMKRNEQNLLRGHRVAVRLLPGRRRASQARRTRDRSSTRTGQEWISRRRKRAVRLRARSR